MYGINQNRYFYTISFLEEEKYATFPLVAYNWDDD